MAALDPSTWAWWTWLLHAIGSYYYIGFWIHFFRFRRLRAKALATGAPDDVFAYDGSLRGFPGAPYAKMLAQRRLADAQGDK